MIVMQDPILNESGSLQMELRFSVLQLHIAIADLLNF
jgi:hypothetical protein